MKAFLIRALVFVVPCMASAQIASLQITVLEGEGAAHPIGEHISRPLTVRVMDDRGQPVAGAAVNFQLPPVGPSGVFSNGLRTDLVITDADGRATIQSIQLNRIAGQFPIRITTVKQLTRDLGEGLHAVVQARGRTISIQYNYANRPTPVAPVEPSPTVNGSPAMQPEPAGPSAERSTEITPTTAKMEPHSSKKWIVLAFIAAACAGAAVAVVVSRPRSSTPAPPSPIVSIGVPTITIGNPNP
jgi:hypothetical protein